MATQLMSIRSGVLEGDVRVPGDKSISHRALILGAVAVGETAIDGLLESDDVMCTAAALGALGARIERGDDGVYRVQGVGVGGLAAPETVLDMGNSGTGARLLIGLVASHPFTCHFTGDASLRARPMARVATPLRRMGARFVAPPKMRLPLAVIGTEMPVPITYRLPVASAQVKSAILFAGLNTPGVTTVMEPAPTRDHSEIMLRHFGAEVAVTEAGEGGRVITLAGQPEISGREISVPGDPSSAAFPAVAALLVPGSEIVLRGIGINPLRAGIYETLREMGADISYRNRRQVAGEPVADIAVRAGALRGVDVPPERAPAMIDEYPVLAVAAACAEGTTRLNGLGELRVKESDRLTAIAEGLAASGVKAEEGEDSLIIQGAGGAPPGGGRIKSQLDHRIAMAFLILGMVADKPVHIDDASVIDTSFPGFAELMNGLGAEIREEPEAA
ncbi:MAG: 3-phosphoshikimate 1-carboxyvinyltransferase [Alphaproteobacteria bacterium]|nr:3-phosphoshikimate 1-carboxyvinyltransferase [Alphaproteobacteria bacterium]